MAPLGLGARLLFLRDVGTARDDTSGACVVTALAPTPGIAVLRMPDGLELRLVADIGEGVNGRPKLPPVGSARCSQKQHLGNVKPQMGDSFGEMSEALARVLMADPTRVCGRRVVELEPSSGMPGIVASALGAQVVSFLGVSLFMVAHNLEVNFSQRPELLRRCHVVRRKLDEVTHRRADRQPLCDVLLANDLASHRAQPAQAQAVITLLDQNSVLLWATRDAPSPDAANDSGQLFGLLAAHGFGFQEVSETDTHAAQENKGDGKRPVRVFHFSRRFSASVPSAPPRHLPTPRAQSRPFRAIRAPAIV